MNRCVLSYKLGKELSFRYIRREFIILNGSTTTKGLINIGLAPEFVDEKRETLLDDLSDWLGV